MFQAIFLFFVVAFLIVLRKSGTLKRVLTSPESKGVSPIFFGVFAWSILMLLSWGVGIIVTLVVDFTMDEFDYMNIVQLAGVVTNILYISRLMKEFIAAGPNESRYELFVRTLRFNAEPTVQERQAPKPEPGAPAAASKEDPIILNFDEPQIKSEKKKDKSLDEYFGGS